MRTSLLLCFTCVLFAAESVDTAALSQREPLVTVLAPPPGTWTTAGPAKDPEVARKADRDALASAGKAFLQAVKTAKAAPDASGRIALEQFVETLGSSTMGNRADALDPIYARRAARGGSLRGIGADAAAPALEKAVVAACKQTTVEQWTGSDGTTLEKRLDAFGVGGWVMTIPASGGKPGRQLYAMPHPGPQFFPAPETALVVEIPVGADPMTDAGKAIAARVVDGDTIAAEWTSATGKLTASGWRKVVPERRGDDIAPGLLPPHIVLCDLDGDVSRLIVEGGELTPLKDGSAAESDRFITDAAKVMSDTPRLDLIGQYLFRYAHDSPDSRFPSLIGGEGATGDIHQTARQTLSTAAGGQCRGDCDDLGELYQTIAEKQGRMGHLLILPGHTAFATAHKNGDLWTVELMQTGPTYAISAPDLPDALRQTWKKFDQTAPFSPDHLGVLLRFSGENQRGHFGLGWRIFSDREYAKTMIDVQRDWQYQTYARAITKMKRLIDAGDKDTANYNELAGLYSVTGQWERAIELQRQTLDSAKDPESILEIRRDLIGYLRRANHLDEAKAELAKAAEDYKAAAPKLGQGAPQAAMTLAMSMLAIGDQESARALVVQDAMVPLTQLLVQIATAVQRGALTPERWQSDGNLMGIRRILGTFVGVQSALLSKAGDKASKDPTLQAMRRNVDLWAARIAFLDAASPAEALSTYAGIAGLHALDVGRTKFDELVAAAVPADGKRDHLQRPLELVAAREADLGWIALSPGYWAMLQGRALTGKTEDDIDEEDNAGAPPDPAKADRAKVVAMGKKVVEVRDRCTKLGLVSEQLDMLVQQTSLVAAVIGGDDALLREKLRYVANRKDKQLYETTSRTLGQLAPYCDTARWTMVLKAWADVVDYQPKWFAIAWAAAVNGAREQALATAKMAAQRFPNEKAFSEEATFMADLLKPSKPLKKESK